MDVKPTEAVCSNINDCVLPKHDTEVYMNNYPDSLHCLPFSVNIMTPRLDEDDNTCCSYSSVSITSLSSPSVVSGKGSKNNSKNRVVPVQSPLVEE